MLEIILTSITLERSNKKPPGRVTGACVVVVTGKQAGLTHMHLKLVPSSRQMWVPAGHGLDWQGDAAFTRKPDSMVFSSATNSTTELVEVLNIFEDFC